MRKLLTLTALMAFAGTVGTLFLRPAGLDAMVFEDVVSFFRGGLVPPEGTPRTGQQDYAVNGEKFRMSFYRSPASPEAVLDHYLRQAVRKGWQHRRDLDLLGALTGATGAARGVLSGRATVEAFQKGDRLVLLGMASQDAEATDLAVIETGQGILRRPDQAPGPLDFLVRQGAQRQCVIQQRGRTGRFYAVIYRVTGGVEQWAGTIQRTLIDAGWSCSAGKPEAEGLCLVLTRKKAQAAVTLTPAGHGTLTVTVWGDLEP